MNSLNVLFALVLSTSISLWFSTRQGGALHIGSARVNEVRLKPAPRSLARDPQRVVSGSLLSDELLEGVLPWERWAAVTYIVDWPESTPASSRFPSDLRRTSGKTEDILSLAPDLVVVSAYNNALTVFQLQDLGLSIYSISSPSTFQGLFEVWAQLGDRIGERVRAQEKIGAARQTLSEIRTIAQSGGTKRRALLLQGTFSYGGISLQGDGLRQAGLENVLEDEAWGANPQVNGEQLLHLDPDVIYVAHDLDEPRRMRRDELPVGYPWEALRAYETRSIIAVPSSWMASISHHALLASLAYATWAKPQRVGLLSREGRR